MTRIAYHQPHHVSPFTPYELYVRMDDGRFANCVHSHVANDPQKRGWGMSPEGERPPAHLLHSDELFDSPEQAVEWRFNDAASRESSGEILNCGCGSAAMRSLLEEIRSAA